MRYPFWPDSSGEMTPLDRYQARQVIALSGTPLRPRPPRSLIAQPGARKVLLTWEFPEKFDDVVGWRVYLNTERQLFRNIADINTRQCDIAVSSGATPPVYNFFVSSVNAGGVESQKVQVQGSATAEAGAPGDPSPPSGSPSSGDTGSTNPDLSGFSDDAGFTR